MLIAIHQEIGDQDDVTVKPARSGGPPRSPGFSQGDLSNPSGMSPA